jgi:hypothetical protein
MPRLAPMCISAVTIRSSASGARRTAGAERAER